MAAPENSPLEPSEPRVRQRVVFAPSATTVYRVALAGLLLTLVATSTAVFAYYHTPYWNRIGIAPSQPVLFSHRHHAGELGIDCRFCHQTVETTGFAGMPATETCLICHSQIFRDTPMLRPVIVSAESNQPLRWNYVNKVPDHVYFDHSIHIAKGVSCTTCHGDVGNSALMAKGEPLSMRWCVDCHENPGPRLQPRDAIFSPHPVNARNDEARGAQLLRDYQIHREHLTDCATCHR